MIESKLKAKNFHRGRLRSSCIIVINRNKLSRIRNRGKELNLIKLNKPASKLMLTEFSKFSAPTIAFLAF